MSHARLKELHTSPSPRNRLIPTGGGKQINFLLKISIRPLALHFRYRIFRKFNLVRSNKI
jgi:hypothetical protein